MISQLMLISTWRTSFQNLTFSTFTFNFLPSIALLNFVPLTQPSAPYHLQRLRSHSLWFRSIISTPLSCHLYFETTTRLPSHWFLSEINYFISGVWVEFDSWSSVLNHHLALVGSQTWQFLELHGICTKFQGVPVLYLFVSIQDILSVRYGYWWCMPLTAGS